jgi:hypothetical protein
MRGAGVNPLLVETIKQDESTLIDNRRAGSKSVMKTEISNGGRPRMR